MVEYFNNIFCIQANWLFGEGEIMNEDSYNYLKRSHQINVVRRGCRNTSALVEYNSLPSRFRALIEHKIGNPRKRIEKSDVEQHIEVDSEAVSYFSHYELDGGRLLPREAQVEYYWNAVVLNAVRKTVNEKRQMHRKMNNSPSGVWQRISDNVNDLNRTKYPHTLPANPRRLQDKYNQYINEGYPSLIHRNFCNANSRVVDERLEQLILSIYCMGNKPYASWVHEDYMKFLAGVLDIVDLETGELFDRNEFWNEKKGTYKTISEATCWNYINKPSNKILVDRLRSGNHRYLSTVRPHFHRHSPQFSLSKISLDDRDLPRKLPDGNRVKAYYAYDVASGCLIGAAYSLRKDRNLFVDCIRDMFRFIDSRGWGMPLEVEVEHHIVREFENDLMKAGLVFPFVRWCAPGNSQEKHAEQLNRQKKYGYEKRYQEGIGRFYLKDKSNQTDGDRVYDEELQKYVIRERTYSFDQLVADDRETIIAYNNGLHRNQKEKEYKGKTRMQILNERLNPDLASINRPLLVRYIGDTTTTSIQRNQYCQVQYNDYMLPSPEVLSRLAPNNYTVQAYYLPAETIREVYLYQNDEFVATARQIETFNTSMAERTESDVAAMTQQAKYIAKFDSLVKRGKAALAKVELMNNGTGYDDIETEIVPVAVPVSREREYDYDPEFCELRAIDSL
jgi:hypothetical protein